MTTIQVKRTSVAGKVPNTQNISIGELGLNMTDRILYSSDGNTVFAIGSNNENITVSNTLTVETRLIVPSSTPANNANGTPGQMYVDGNYIYVCTATNTWKRALLSTF